MSCIHKCIVLNVDSLIADAKNGEILKLQDSQLMQCQKPPDFFDYYVD